MRKIVLALIATVLTLGGCTAPEATNTAPEPSADTTEAAFLSVVREEVPALEDVPDESLVEVGEDACDLMEEASPLTEQELFTMADGFSEGTDGIMTPRDSAFFLGAASGAFCPSVADEIDSLLQSNS